MSKIRFLKATTNYPSYISAILKKYPELKELDYQQAQVKYFYDAYGWANFWKTNLEASGKFECEEVIINAEFLQRKWARENKFTPSDDKWQNEILVQQIKAFKPDVLFLVDQYNDNSVSGYIKKEVPSIKLLLGWDGILWHRPQTYAHCDAILTAVSDTAEYYRKLGKVSYLHKFGFEPDVLNRLTKLQEPYHISFTGSVVAHPDYHLSRVNSVAKFQRKVGMNIWASSLQADWNLFKPGRIWHTVRRRQWQLAYDLHTIGRHNKGEVFGLDMFNVLYNSKIIFNTHGDNSPRLAANMRMTEVTGTGTLLLTDWKENISDFFKPDEEVVTYKTLDEALDKTKMLLNDDNLRSTIAANGQKRTLTEYSYKERMKELANFILNAI